MFLYNGWNVVTFNECQHILALYRHLAHISIDIGNSIGHRKIHIGQPGRIDQTPVVVRKGTDKQTLWPQFLLFGEYRQNDIILKGVHHDREELEGPEKVKVLLKSLCLVQVTSVKYSRWNCPLHLIQWLAIYHYYHASPNMPFFKLQNFSHLRFTSK